MFSVLVILPRSMGDLAPGIDKTCSVFLISERLAKAVILGPEIFSVYTFFPPSPVFSFLNQQNLYK